jgi:hypothetical protein
MVGEISTNPNDVSTIPKSDLPLMVFSDNMRSFLSWGIKVHEHGYYNHFMWMMAPGKFVSQDWILHEVPSEKYLEGKHRLKFVRGSDWNFVQKTRIRIALRLALNKSWWKKLYDPVQILGIAVGCKWFQIPGNSRICSDYGYVLKEFDHDYDLVHPSPTEINQWTKNHNYEVYLRFFPD